MSKDNFPIIAYISEKIKTSRHNQRRRSSFGFTIVELLIIVVVIAILAAITIVSYNGIQRQAAGSVVQTILRDAAKSMEIHKIKEGSYPEELPGWINIPSGFGVGVAQVSNPQQEFCLSATSQRFSDIHYSTDQTQEIKSDICPGEIIATYGDYNNGNSSEVDSQPWLTAPTAGHVTAPGDMEFTASTDDTWSMVSLSWKAMEGAVRYRLNHSNASTGDSNWSTRNIADGSSGWAWNSTNGGASGMLPPSTTSLTWTSTISRPVDMSQTHRYRIQYLNSDNVWSEWQELALSPSEGRTMPEPSNFKVTPSADWSQVVVSWDSIGNYGNLPGVKFRLNHNYSTEGGVWSTRNIADGSSGWAWNSTNSGASGMLPPSTTSLTWTSTISRPANAAQTHHYRIQLYSGSVEGPWATFSLDPLEVSPMPEVSNFQVSPSADWSSLNLSWDSIEDTSLPGLRIRINSRTSPTSSWYVRNANGSSGWSWDANVYSGAIPQAEIQQTWSGSIPSLGQTYDYRIQAYSGAIQGPWATATLSR